MTTKSGQESNKTAHEVMKSAYTHGTKLYRVTIHKKNGPSLVTLNKLSSGQTFSFDRLGKSGDNKSTILRLTQSEVSNLLGAHFTVEKVDAADVESIDPFGDPMSDSVEGSTILTPSDWSLVSTPVEYLDNNPDGPKAELARQMIENGLPNVSSKK